jgi:hypothetical protein
MGRATLPPKLHEIHGGDEEMNKEPDRCEDNGDDYPQGDNHAAAVLAPVWRNRLA